ncbi:MAG TPA: HAMP domain-containing protein [Spirochaetota bacterium]|nr:HAMP domain-containing protein [Spirochaetota bacterium]HPI91104.1 HAMP domain-containing protein [Spirochaetota bacterium]HPR48689.1 HAMP domain-containing protein [Spirochaetota bacterium]
MIKGRSNKDKSKGTSLRKKMIFYFLLIAIANIFVAGEILWEIKSADYRTNVAQEVTLIKEGAKPVTHVYMILDNLSRKFVIMILILIVVSAVVLFLFVWQIASPIQYMINQAEKMADGDLSIRIDIKSKDEMAVLGKLVNELSINLQEVLAQLERMTADMHLAIELFKEDLGQKPIRLSTINQNIAKIESHLKKLDILKDMFVLYTIESFKKNIDS